MDAWVVMPNHVHGILMITNKKGGTARRAPTVKKTRAMALRRGCV